MLTQDCLVDELETVTEDIPIDPAYPVWAITMSGDMFARVGIQQSLSRARQSVQRERDRRREEELAARQPRATTD